MNERYLFRGKSIDTKKWIYGGFHKWEKRQICPMGDSLKEDDVSYVITINSFADWNMPRNMQAVEVILETVGQCTGTPDKNDKFIFDGDIVKAYKHNETPYTRTVTFRDGCFWFSSWNWTEFLNIFRNVEVIGNIHDNPELTEVEK